MQNIESKKSIILKERMHTEFEGLKSDLQQLKNFKTWISIAQYLSIIFLSCILVGIAAQFFLEPAKLGTSGFTGVSLLLRYVLGWDIGTTALLMNLPFIILGFPILGRRFVIHSTVGVGMLKLALWITSPMALWKAYHVQDIWLSLIYGGVILGLGAGMALKIGGNTGGVDLVALINRYFTKMKLGTTIMIFDSSVILASWKILGAEKVLYTLISIMTYTTVIRLILERNNKSQTVTVISHKSREIIANIQQKLHRGTTVLKGQGGYTEDDKEVLYICVLKKELHILQNIIQKIDNKAFIVIQNADEISGNGFTIENKDNKEILKKSTA